MQELNLQTELSVCSLAGTYGATNQSNNNTMLKKRVTNLMFHYEYGNDIYTADEVLEELQEIVDDERYTPGLTDELNKAINDFVLAKHECNRYHGHCDDGSDAFIAEVERIIGFDD